MRSRIFVRPAKPQESEKYLQWALETPENYFDPDSPAYRSTITLCAYDREGPIVFMPIMQPLVMDAIAVRPGADPHRVAESIKCLVQETIMQAHLKDSGEIYFLAKKEETCDFSNNQDVFEELPLRVFRLKVKNLECPSPS